MSKAPSQTDKRFLGHIRTWTSHGTAFFKIGEINLPETRDAGKLEAAAKACARGIEAEAMYAWGLPEETGLETGSAWWLGWGGYDLEDEIPYHAAVTRDDAKAAIAAFDPADNDFDCSDVEEFMEILYAQYDDVLTEEDLKRGFLAWLEELDEEARATFERDMLDWKNKAAACKG